MIWLHSVLHTYYGTLHHSTNVHKVFQSPCGLHYKHFVPFFTTSLQLVLYIGLQFQSTIWIILYLRTSFLIPFGTSHLCSTNVHFVPFCTFLHVLQSQPYNTLETHLSHSDSHINHIINSLQQHHVFLLCSAIVHTNSKEAQSTSMKVHQIWQPLMMWDYIHFVLLCWLYHRSKQNQEERVLSSYQDNCFCRQNLWLQSLKDKLRSSSQTLTFQTHLQL